MRSASIRDLHIWTRELVQEAAAGAVIIIGRSGEPVAEPRSISQKARGDSRLFLEEDR